MERNSEGNMKNFSGDKEDELVGEAKLKKGLWISNGWNNRNHKIIQENHFR